MIPIFKPSIKRRDMDAVLTVLVSEQIGFHDVSRQLIEQAVAFLDLKAGIPLREYERAAGIAYDALNLEEGAVVLMSPLTPSAYFDAAASRRLEVVLVDVNSSDLCMDTDKIAEVMEREPAAMVVHHSLGILPDMEKYLEFEVPVIEDISYSLGARAGEAAAGSFGKVVVLSLEEDFLITSGGGALVLSGNGKIASFLKARTRNADPGILLPDMNAALALSQLQAGEKLFSARKEIAPIFRDAAMKSRHKCIFRSDGEGQSFFAFPLIIDSGMPEVTRYASKKKVETRLLFDDRTIINRIENRDDYPIASSFSLRCLLFPLYPMLGKKNVELMAKVLSTLP